MSFRADGSDATGRIQPAGMSYRRAYEIAVAADAKRGFSWAPAEEDDAELVVVPRSQGSPTVNSGRPTGKRLSADKREAVIRLLKTSMSNNEIALRAEVSSRAVARYRMKLGIPSTFYGPTVPPSLLVVGRTQK